MDSNHRSRETPDLQSSAIAAMRFPLSDPTENWTQTFALKGQRHKPLDHGAVRSGRPGSNRRHRVWKTRTLPTELHPRFYYLCFLMNNFAWHSRRGRERGRNRAVSSMQKAIEFTGERIENSTQEWVTCLFIYTPENGARSRVYSWMMMNWWITRNKV